MLPMWVPTNGTAKATPAGPSKKTSKTSRLWKRPSQNRWSRGAAATKERPASPVCSCFPSSDWVRDCGAAESGLTQPDPFAAGRSEKAKPVRFQSIEAASGYNARMKMQQVLPLVALLVTACSTEPKYDPASCETITGFALAECTASVARLHADCLETSDALCEDADGDIVAAFDDLRADVNASCETADLLDEAAAARLAGLVAACDQEATSLVGRVAGGPHAAVWAAASDSDRECLATALSASIEQVEQSTISFMACADQACSDATVANARAPLQDVTVIEVEEACPALAGLIALDPSQLVHNNAGQVDCIAAMGRPDIDDLGLTCGPSAAEFDVPRGQWSQVVVDGERWGTLCGDRTDYAFWIRPAPEGSPIDKVLIGLEGGGVCVFADDCGPKLERSPELFSALDNEEPLPLAIASDDPNESPFSEWTQVYLPYCNQDVFAGGGVDEDLGGGLVLPRYGSINARAAITMVRNWMWRTIEDDPTRPEGFRADQVQALIGGWSAGSYGTLYNYHWVLDDLGWARTTAFPDAGLALDNEQPLGVRALGLVKIPLWGTLPYLPPYCFSGDCALASVLTEALAPRLLSVPEQQMLLLTNQIDDIQAGDSYFTSREGFLNALRSTYCDTKDLNGVAWYLTSVEASVHVVTLRTELWNGSVGGMVMKDWMAQAAISGEVVDIYAEEANFMDLVPGTTPFPCAVD
ncbi:MAG TPA: hypothetical protein DFR83_02165 [Deltaproteobacteria bacterium]|nr:hypothetical protein [Deltaproteobacteria bacterium]